MVVRGWGNGEMGNYKTMGIKFQLSKINSRDLLYNIVPMVKITAVYT